jgi:hypothetical protein
MGHRLAFVSVFAAAHAECSESGRTGICGLERADSGGDVTVQESLTRTALVTHRGGCHCGAVRFEVDAAAEIVVHACNCSICRMTGFLHLIVPASRFRLLMGHDALVTYRFNTGTAQHLFCRCCGIKSFYVPRSNPDGFSINVNCLDRSTLHTIDVRAFDGEHWEQSADALRPLSADDAS